MYILWREQNTITQDFGVYWKEKHKHMVENRSQGSENNTQVGRIRNDLPSGVSTTSNSKYKYNTKSIQSNTSG